MSTATQRRPVDDSKTLPTAGLIRNQSTLLHPSSPVAEHPPLQLRPHGRHNHTAPPRHRVSNDYAPRSISYHPSTKVKPKPNSERTTPKPNVDKNEKPENATPPPDPRYDDLKSRRRPSIERKSSSLLHPSTPESDSEAQKQKGWGQSQRGSYVPEHAHSSPDLVASRLRKRLSTIHSSQSLVPKASNDDGENTASDNDSAAGQARNEEQRRKSSVSVMHSSQSLGAEEEGETQEDMATAVDSVQ